MARRVVLMLMVAFALNIYGATAQVRFEDDTLENLVAKADESKRLLFVDLYALWCSPCKMMERDVFSREDVGKFMERYFVSAKFNVDDKMGGAMLRQYNVHSIPTYLIFDGGGVVVGRMSGVMSPKDFMEALKGVYDSICM